MTTRILSLNRLALPAALFFLSLTIAQSAPDLAPTPRLAVAPASSSWEIAYQYPGPNPYLKPPPDPSQADVYARLRNQYPRLLSIQVTKDGNKRKEVYTLDNGVQKIRWICGGLMVVEDVARHHSTLWDEIVPGNEHFSRDFEAFSSIDTSDFKGRQNFQQREVFVYAVPGGNTLYVDTKTGLPVVVQQGSITITYSFNPASRPFEIPAEIKSRIEQYQQAAEAPKNP